MLYKVTPALAPVGRGPASARGGAQPKKRRASAVFDAEGHEVLITLMCLKCRSMKPLGQFGLRRMPDGAIRNQPWCRHCRGAVTPKKKPQATVDAASDAPPTSPGGPIGSLDLGPANDPTVPVPPIPSLQSSEPESLEDWAGLGRE
jgi:hypothetical protein